MNEGNDIANTKKNTEFKLVVGSGRRFFRAGTLNVGEFVLLIFINIAGCAILQDFGAIGILFIVLVNFLVILSYLFYAVKIIVNKSFFRVECPLWEFEAPIETIEKAKVKCYWLVNLVVVSWSVRGKRYRRFCNFGNHLGYHGELKLLARQLSVLLSHNE